MRLYFDLHRELSLEGFLGLLASRLPQRPVAADQWIAALDKSYRELTGGRLDPDLGRRLAGRLHDVRIQVGPVPVDVGDSRLLVAGLPGFYAVEVPGARIDPGLMALFKAHGQPAAGLPSAKVCWVEEFRTPEGLGARIWGLQDTGARVAAAILLQTNIDDMNPEMLGYLMERLFTLGARDVYFTPITMKKSRPATTVNVLVHPQDEAEMVEALFAETSTLGIRRIELDTWVLARSSKTVVTRYGTIRVKIGWLDGRVRSVHPEYEDCRRAAQNLGIPLQEVYREAIRVFEGQADDLPPSPSEEVEQA